MNSPELLLLVENCPKGAETLVTRCLHSLTDKGAPRGPHLPPFPSSSLPGTRVFQLPGLPVLLPPEQGLAEGCCSEVKCPPFSPTSPPPPVLASVPPSPFTPNTGLPPSARSPALPGAGEAGPRSVPQAAARRPLSHPRAQWAGEGTDLDAQRPPLTRTGQVGTRVRSSGHVPGCGRPGRTVGLASATSGPSGRLLPCEPGPLSRDLTGPHGQVCPPSAGSPPAPSTCFPVSFPVGP